MGKYGNEPQFAETQVVLALLNDDEEEAQRIVGNFFNNEMAELAHVAYWMLDVLKEERQRRASARWSEAPEKEVEDG